ncbi:hypothetical protein [Brevibacillus sp. NRS-1366]|uniref:hypothetical protein n=1 Tax=Brevibacillus sp. NRS-1366 TaxID=3233899 RepID=UPI003D23D789
MKRTRLVLWALDPRLTLIEVQDKLKKDYVQHIGDLLQSSVPTIEKTLNHRWIVYDKSFRQSRIANKPIEYIFAKGILELQNGPRDLRFDRDGRLMPKHARVKEKEIETLFFEMEGRVYSVLATAEYLEPNVRSKLFLKDHEWGHIDYRELPQYKFDHNFFNWLILKKGKTIKDPFGNELSLLDVAGFSGESHRGASTFTGSGGNIANQPVTQTMISMSSPFHKLELTLEYQHMRIHFELGKLSECKYDDEKTYKKSGPDEHGFVNVHEAIISIYYEIIPLLNAAFHKEILDGTFRLRYDQYQKQTGLHVIEDIARQLDLSSVDILSLNFFKGKSP